MSQNFMIKFVITIVFLTFFLNNYWFLKILIQTLTNFQILLKNHINIMSHHKKSGLIQDMYIYM